MVEVEQATKEYFEEMLSSVEGVSLAEDEIELERIMTDYLEQGSPKDALVALVTAKYQQAEDLRDDIVNYVNDKFADLLGNADQFLEHVLLYTAQCLDYIDQRTGGYARQVLGDVAYEKFSELSAMSVDMGNLMDWILDFLVSRYTKTQVEAKPWLSVLLSVALSALPEDQRANFTMAMSAAAAVYSASSEVFTGVYDLFRSMFGGSADIKLGEMYTGVRNGQSFTAFNLGPYTIIVSDGTRQGFDVKVYQTKAADEVIVSTITRTVVQYLKKIPLVGLSVAALEKMGFVRVVKEVVTVVKEIYRYDQRVSEFTRQLDAPYFDVSALLSKAMFSAFSGRRSPEPEPSPEDPGPEPSPIVKPDEVAQGLQPDGFIPLRKRRPETTEQTTNAFQRAQASRARRIDAQ